jgi:hypothetical protein
MSLGFVHPALLWGLLAAAIPLAIHLFFRRRPRPTPFPAIDFILKARRETERRLRLKKLLLFTARTLLLAALALALARPRLEAPATAAAATPRGPRATAIVLDASGSMRYRLGGSTLFERARGDALGALAALGPDEPATAVVCGGPGDVQVEAPGFDRGEVRRALERAEADAGYADVTACVAAAARALSASAATQPGLGHRIVVATDLAASAWHLDQPAPVVETPAGPGGPAARQKPEVAVLDAARGAPLPNAAVLSADAEPDPAAGPRGYRITATVANFGDQHLSDLPLSLVVGTGKEARTAIRALVDVPAGGTARKSLSHAFAQGGPAVLQLQLPGDALPDDDARALALVVPREVRALVVDGSPSPVRYRDEAFYVESALASPASPVRPTLVDAEALPAQDLSRFDVVFLLNVRSPGAKAADLARFVEQGGGLFVAVGDQVDPESYGKELPGLLPAALHLVKTAPEGRAARFGEVDLSHPALSVFQGEAKEGLVGVRTQRWILAKPAGGASGQGTRVLASFDDGSPALLEARRGKGRILLLTTSADRDWTDWPIRTSFLPAMQRFAGWLSGGLDDRREPAGRVGEPRTLRLEPGEELAALVGPDGRERRRAELERTGLKEDGGALRFAPRLPGLWQVKVTAGGAERAEPRLAFSVAFDPRESDTRRLRPDELTAWLGGASHAKVEGDAQAGGGARTVPLWSILLVLGVAAFFLEGLLIA